VNRALKRISLAVLAMFLLLLINVNYIQGFDTTALSKLPFNTRTITNQAQYERGPIITADGVTIAASRPVNDIFKYQRYYPDGVVYAPVTGYDSIFSTTGIEHSYNNLLSGQDSSLAFRNIIDMITNKPRKGATVELTINSKAQNAAYDGLKAILQGTGRVGGAVAINPQTGAVLAMASYPSYDPNALAAHDGTAVNKSYQALLATAGNPLLNHATESTFPPGSTFKIVTSSAWFTQDSARNPQSLVESPTTLQLPQTTHILHNDLDLPCGNGSGKTTLNTAFTESCDTTFANLGMDIGTQALKTTADGYGFNNQNLTVSGLPVASSNYIEAPGAALTAFSAIGQYSDTASALQEAMLAAAIAHGGTLMQPYLVQQVTASDLSAVQTATPRILSQPVTSAVANNVKQMMISVVQSPDGTANKFSAANEGGLVIAGKTGTAQNGINSTGLDDAVFTAFAPADNPQIAVGVIVQGGGFGAAAAAPVAVQVIKAYLGTR
jgi:penicillin-binding protein A